MIGRRFIWNGKIKNSFILLLEKCLWNRVLKAKKFIQTYISGANLVLRVGGSGWLLIGHFSRLLGAFRLPFLQPKLLFLKCEANPKLLVGNLNEFSDVVHFGVGYYVAGFCLHMELSGGNNKCRCRQTVVPNTWTNVWNMHTDSPRTTN